MKTITIGTRGSDLARTQTETIAKMIRDNTDLKVQTKIIKTKGDRIQDVPLHLVDGKGFFTKEIEEALLGKEIDLAIHSLKDLPTENPPGLTIAAVPERERAEDILLVRNDVINSGNRHQLPPVAAVGTSSKRRALQMKALYPSVKIKELRGNVPTRINKLMEGQYDAIVLAYAGFRRLNLEPRGYRLIVLPFQEMLPAPGQGALALQTREDDYELNRILANFHHEATAIEVEAERALLTLLGGGCGMPLGVKAEKTDSGISMKAILGPKSWELHDQPSYKKAEASAADIDSAARLVLEKLN